MDADEIQDMLDKIGQNEDLEGIAKSLNKEVSEVFTVEETWTCDCCGEKHYRLVAKEITPEIAPGQRALDGGDAYALAQKVCSAKTGDILGQLDTCGICGDSECQDYNDYGERVHAEYMHDYSWGSAETVCYGCQEDMRCGVVVYDKTGEHQSFPADKGMIVHWDDYSLEIDDRLEKALNDIANSIHWHRSSAWRGYYDFKVPDGWKCIADGWHSTMDETEMSRFLNELGTRGEGFPIIKVFCGTSNVCSVGVDILVPEEVENAFLEAEMPPEWATCYNIAVNENGAR